MYERFYGVKERPFTLLPDPEFLFLSDKHKAALEMLELAIANHSGFCVVSGEIGAGKTTLIREILNRLDDSVRVGLVSNTHASFGELMQWVMAAYGLPSDSSDKLELHKQFIDFAIQQYAENRHTLLIIDEAQNLSVASLEELRMLSNVNSDKDFVLQIMLVGQHQLRDRLDDPALVQFVQRIALDYHLEGLSAAETRDYIRHRLRHAGGDPELFSDGACGAVYEASKGIPRLINRLCDLCLVYGCTEERAHIEDELVNRVVADQRSGRLLSTCELVEDELVEQAPVVEQGSRESAATEPATGISESREALPGEEVVATAEPEPAANKDVEAMPVAALSAVASEKLEAAGSDAGETIKAMSSALLPQREAPGQSAEERPVASEEHPQAELHELVVNAEKQQAAGGERGALWLLAGVLVLAVGAGWMTRDLWLEQGTGYTAPHPVAASRPAPVARSAPAVSEQALEEAPETVAEQPHTALADSGENAGDGTNQTVVTPVSEEDSHAVESAEPLVLVDTAAQEAEQRQAELEREAESKRQAEQKREAEARRARLEREAEERRQAELKREAERLAKLQAEAERLERQRLETERMLAEQKAAREALEREAREEQQRVVEARKAAEKAAADRALAEQQLSRQQVLQAASPERTPINAQTRVVTESAESVEKTTNPSATLATLDGEASVEPAEPVEEEKPDVRFSTNPCNGPTARFMSTCR